jgi:hypothetical protein
MAASTSACSERKHPASKRGVATRVAAVLAILASHAAFAVTGVNPTGVNVNATGVTSVFLTFLNLQANEQPVEAFWCGDLTVGGGPSLVTSFDPCVPGTLFGLLPARNNLSQRSGTGGFSNFTDIMTIPASVSRRAYQAAQSGSISDFFYVRHFNDGVQDTYVTVTCRLTGGGARTPLALTEVRLYFDTPQGQRPMNFLERSQPLPPFAAEIRYNGAGRLTGRWELVKPGDSDPSVEDLLTEASLPVEQRGLQRRYTLIDRFDVFLQPGRSVTLPGPDPKLVNADVDGPYKILLRVEATHEKEGNSDTLAGIVASGGVAGFPMPVLQFFVGDGETLAAAQDAIVSNDLTLLLPGAAAEVGAELPASFSWITIPQARAYRFELRNLSAEILTAVVGAGTAAYTTPPWALREAGAQLRWRVVALDAQGRSVAQSSWRQLETAAAAVTPSTAP